MSVVQVEDDDVAMLRAYRQVRGRGTGDAAKGRFERLEVAYVPGEEEQVGTELFLDSSRSIIAMNDSPDVGFSASLNAYRGCEHGCIYCYARPTHEYLGMSAGLDFESKLFVKPDAPSLLREALSAGNWTPQPIGISGVTDCYQPVERKLEITRQCLEVLAEFRNPVVVITKNHLVTRDIDLLKVLASHNAVHVCVSITTLDPELARRMEPRASSPARRLEAVRLLKEAGVPVSVNIAPVVPGLTDHEIPSILKACAEAGAMRAQYVLLRLPHRVKDLFADWLEMHYPLRKEKVLSRIRETRGGKLYNAQFGSRMCGEGVYAGAIANLFTRYRVQYKLDGPWPALSTAHFRRMEKQLSLFK